MSVKLSITIMAHPERKHFIPYLQERIGGDVPVIFDEKQNIWDTCRRAWLAQDMSADYGLVIQDDALLCDNFRQEAEAFIENHSDQDFIYSFYAGQLLSTRIGMAERKGIDYVVSGMIFNEVALCMRTKHIERMVKFCDDREAKTDQDITKWARLARIRIMYSVPSLVDHRDGESIYRRVYNRPPSPKDRKAFRFKTT